MRKKIKIIGFIPAKKNSREFKKKNLKTINDLSLFEIAILNAKKSKLIDEIYLSSDSDEILKKGKKFNINVVRRKKSLCNYNTTANSVILDFIKNNLFNQCKEQDFIIVYLQPTSPFRNKYHIDESIKLYFKNKLRTLVSVNENKNFFKSFYLSNKSLNPYFDSKFITKNRQNFKKIYSPNGAIYIFYCSDFLRNNKINFVNSGYYLMNKIDSIDIDNKEDYELAKFISKKYLK